MADLSHLSTAQPIDIEALRLRLTKMTDAELQKFGAASKFMCSPKANLGKPPRDFFAIQLCTGGSPRNPPSKLLEWFPQTEPEIKSPQLVGTGGFQRSQPCER